jgi:hypothetical protein
VLDDVTIAILDEHVVQHLDDDDGDVDDDVVVELESI